MLHLHPSFAFLLPRFSTAELSQMPDAGGCLRGAQPFSSRVNTLLRGTSANHAPREANAGTRPGKPQLPPWLRAGGRLLRPPAQTPQTRVDRGDTYPNREPCGERGEAEVLPWHLGASMATAKGQAWEMLFPAAAGMLLEPRADPWPRVLGCSCPEMLEQAGEGCREPSSWLQQGKEQRPAIPATGHWRALATRP